MRQHKFTVKARGYDWAAQKVCHLLHLEYIESKWLGFGKPNMVTARAHIPGRAEPAEYQLPFEIDKIGGYGSKTYAVTVDLPDEAEYGSSRE